MEEFLPLPFQRETPFFLLFYHLLKSECSFHKWQLPILHRFYILLLNKLYFFFSQLASQIILVNVLLFVINELAGVALLCIWIWPMWITFISTVKRGCICCLTFFHLLYLLWILGKKNILMARFIITATLNTCVVIVYSYMLRHTY